uniref:Cell division cycle 20 homolog n=1 Tax=Labrus bergylta TaxID=56723 RepID=A0A3Q3FZV5_9LABR
MAHFQFENDIQSILNLDIPILNVSMAKSQRKAYQRKNTKSSTSKMWDDCFIPIRNGKQMDVASFLLSKEIEPIDTNNTTENQKAWSTSLNGYNIEEAKILHLGGKPLNAVEGKGSLYISLTPYRLLETPELRNDFCNSVFLWDESQEEITLLMKLECEEDYICSLCWTKEGSHLAVGTSDCKVQLWDVDYEKHLRSRSSHTARVGSLSWNDHPLSGSRSGHIYHHDVRVSEHHISTLSGHSMEALAWCPWQPNILAYGGVTMDRHIRISGSCISSFDTRSQISSLLFAPNHKELVSAHGYDHNNVVIWKYPSFTKVAEHNDHKDRVLSLTLSPDFSSVATVAGDDIRLWKCFEVNPVEKKAKERMVKSTSSVIHQSIR